MGGGRVETSGRTKNRCIFLDYLFLELFRTPLFQLYIVNPQVPLLFHFKK